MKFIFSVFFSLLFSYLFLSGFANAQDKPSYSAYISKADSLYNAKDYKNSADAYAKAFAIEMKNPLDLYNAACSAALAGDKDNAFKYLNASVEKGWTDIRHMKSDGDLISLHPEQRWDEVVVELSEKLEKSEAGYDKPLQKILLEVLDSDQKYRQQIDSIRKTYGYESPQVNEVFAKIIVIDSINLIIVTRILDSLGWVGKDKIGREANQAIFLVIQHAPYEVQLKYLPMMRDAVKKGNASPASLALLEDRVAIRGGAKQIYGSQIGYDKETNKNFVLPLEDPDNVDKRRAEMGMGPLADYVRRWNIIWNAEDFKKEQAEREARK